MAAMKQKIKSQSLGWLLEDIETTEITETVCEKAEAAIPFVMESLSEGVRAHLPDGIDDMPIRSFRSCW